MVMLSARTPRCFSPSLNISMLARACSRCSSTPTLLQSNPLYCGNIFGEMSGAPAADAASAIAMSRAPAPLAIPPFTASCVVSALGMCWLTCLTPATILAVASGRCGWWRRRRRCRAGRQLGLQQLHGGHVHTTGRRLWQRIGDRIHALFEHCAGVGVAASLRCNEEARHDLEKLFGVNVRHVMW
jgi:hypothetical protein